jgi:YD repeat-containing protein
VSCQRIAYSLLLALIAASSAQAGAYASANQRAADWLESQQDTSDGSWRDSSEARTYLQTAEAVLALHQANRRRAPYYAGQTWIENHDPKNLDARARRLLVLRATQSSAQPDIDALLAAVSIPAAGQAGWGLARRYRAAPLDTALALDALRTVGAGFNSTHAIAYLKTTQLTPAGDQGWPATAGSSTDAYTTARVVQALAAYKASDTSLTTPLANAVATLKAKVSLKTTPNVTARLKYIDNAWGDRLTLAYDANGRLSTVTDNLGISGRTATARNTNTTP